MSATLDWRLTFLWFADIWSLSKNIGGDVLPNKTLCSACCEFFLQAAHILVVTLSHVSFVSQSYRWRQLPALSRVSLMAMRGLTLDPLTARAGNVDVSCKGLERLQGNICRWFARLQKNIQKLDQPFDFCFRQRSHARTSRFTVRDAHCEFLLWHSCSNG